MNWIVKIAGAAMILFVVWLVAVILFDNGTGPCIQLGGC